MKSMKDGVDRKAKGGIEKIQQIEFIQQSVVVFGMLYIRWKNIVPILLLL